MDPMDGVDSLNASLYDYVESVLGPRWAPVHIVVSTVIIYSLILLGGLSANLFVIAFNLINSRKLCVSDWYLLSLAVSDIVLLLLGLTLELHDARTQLYPYSLPEVVCRGRAFLTELTSITSALTIAAFSVQRYLAICHPLKDRSHLRPKRRTLGIICLVWLTGIIGALPCLFLVKINSLVVLFEESDGVTKQRVSANQNAEIIDSFLSDGPSLDPMAGNKSSSHAVRLPDSEYCYFDESDSRLPRIYVQLCFWLSFLLPLVLIVILYVRIALAIRRALVFNITSNRSHRELSKRKAAVNMSIAVATAFFICWLPFHLQRLLTIYASENASVELQNVQSWLFFVSGYFYYSSTVVNAVLYTLMTERMRIAVLRAVLGRRANVLVRQFSRTSISAFRTSRTSLFGQGSPLMQARKCQNLPLYSAADRRRSFARRLQCLRQTPDKTVSSRFSSPVSIDRITQL